MPTEDEVKKTLKDIADRTPDYPPELKTATKAEYMTHVHDMTKNKPGCRMMAGALLLVAGGIGYSIYQLFLMLS